MSIDFSNIRKSAELVGEQGQVMRFPTRRDYLDLLYKEGLIGSTNDFVSNAALNELVYLDWLRRGQIGCVFAQLLARPELRECMKTAVLMTKEPGSDMSSLARDIDGAVHAAVADPSAESLSVLLPEILVAERLAELMLTLQSLPGWKIEGESRWRKTLMTIGLRVEIEKNVWAEILGLGPFPFLPPTRQSPITSLEIRVKSHKAQQSKLNPKMKAAHLARIPTDDFLTPKESQIRFKRWTPALKRRMLAGVNDTRAKASVTYALPAAIWSSLKQQRHEVRGSVAP